MVQSWPPGSQTAVKKKIINAISAFQELYQYNFDLYVSLLFIYLEPKNLLNRLGAGVHSTWKRAYIVSK